MVNKLTLEVTCPSPCGCIHDVQIDAEMYHVTLRFYIHT